MEVHQLVLLLCELSQASLGPLDDEVALSGRDVGSLMRSHLKAPSRSAYHLC